MIYFAGIGSRETPKMVQDEMKELVKYSIEHMSNCIWRSGGARGADDAIMEAAGVNFELMLPRQMHRGHWVENYCDPLDDSEAVNATIETHPMHKALLAPSKESLLRLHARNYQIISGTIENRQDVEAVLCWTPDGYDGHFNPTRHKTLSGGTGQGIALAVAKDIPVYNIYHPLVSNMFIDHIDALVTSHKYNTTDMQMEQKI